MCSIPEYLAHCPFDNNTIYELGKLVMLPGIEEQPLVLCKGGFKWANTKLESQNLICCNLFNPEILSTHAHISM